MAINDNPRVSSTAFLHPGVRGVFEELAEDLQAKFKAGQTRSLFYVFETYRTPQRQEALFHNVPRVTQARAWQSAHNFGLAVDFVPKEIVNGVSTWSWAETHDWPFLKTRALHFGLRVPLTWDRGHVEAKQWAQHGALLRNLGQK